MHAGPSVDERGAVPTWPDRPAPDDVTTGRRSTATVYVHGRPLREVREMRARRARAVRRVLVVGVLVVVAALVGPRALGALGGVLAEATGSAPRPSPTALDPDLQARFDEAAAAAAAEGVTLQITSGWRSAAEQQAIVEQTVQQYGSADEAHRFVLPPERSAHVQGLAIDVGPVAGAAWLDAHGAAYGLCRTYANETWHFEPVIAPGGTCPAMRPDSSWGWTGS
jgi:hypothetical protein